MKSYTVQIAATDETGKEIRFSEIVVYYNVYRLTNEQYRLYGHNYPRHMLTVDEEVREAKAVQQVTARYPGFKNVRALSSIATNY